MLEVLHESLKAPNLPATFLLILVSVFWLISLIGLVDLDLDFDVDADADVDADGHLETGGGGNFFNSILQFFHVGELPVTIIISFFSLFFWMGSVLLNHYLHNDSMLLGLIFMLPAVFGAAFLTKVVTKPILKIYRKLKAEEEQMPSDFSGSVVVITSEGSEDRLGQGEINRAGDSIKVYIKTMHGEVKKGQSALLIEYKKELGYYIAAPYEQESLSLNIS